MTDAPKPSVSERLRELADGEGDQPILQAQMRALATEIEELAEDIRAQKGWLISDGDFGQPHTYDEWADALAPREPK